MVDDRIASARILIVDDEEDNVQVLRRILEAEGYTEIRSTNDPLGAAEVVAEYQPDLVLLDVVMPGMSGHKVLERLREPDVYESYRPVLVLTSDHSRQAQRDAWAAGAKDFITKPLSPSEVRQRVRNLLETRMLHRMLREHADELEDRVRARTAELEEARIQMLFRLARAAEYRDDDTGQHTRRVGRSAGRIAQALGLQRDDVVRIRLAAPLHDVGKIGIPDSILLSTGRLSPSDFEVMKGHCAIGAALLSSPDVPLLQLAAEIAMSHHECWNGSGYPHGLAGEDVPLPGRIVAVADTYDALTHARPYKEAWSTDAALAEIRRLSGVSFDPDVVTVFEGLCAEDVAARRSAATVDA
ncbi:MAG: HD domain-containing phosphohydrolase [Gemmatimonadota bacterium]